MEFSSTLFGDWYEQFDILRETQSFDRYAGQATDMPEGESRGGADISETVATGLLCKNMDHAATDLVSKPADLGRDELAGMQDLPQAWDFFTFSEARGQIPPQAEKSPSHTVGDIVNLGPASQVPPTPQFLLELDQANLSKAAEGGATEVQREKVGEAETPKEENCQTTVGDRWLDYPTTEAFLEGLTPNDTTTGPGNSSTTVGLREDNWLSDFIADFTASESRGQIPTTTGDASSSTDDVAKPGTTSPLLRFQSKLEHAKPSKSLTKAEERRESKRKWERRNRQKKIKEKEELEASIQSRQSEQKKLKDDIDKLRTQLCIYEAAFSMIQHSGSCPQQSHG